MVKGDGDLADVCRLTCLEQGVKVASTGGADRVPVLRVEGMDLALI